MLKKLFTITAIALSSLTYGQKISAGDLHSLFLCSDGSLKVWGYSSYAELGLGDFTHRLLPEANTQLAGITAISGGKSYSLFLKSDGTVWGCGVNDRGQLGNGTYANQSNLVQANGLSGIIAISGRSYHSLFLKSDGTVWASGMGSYGQLGTGNNNYQNTPVQVSGLSGIIAISAGSKYSLFLKSDGTVWACGYNDFGQLGNGYSVIENTPVQINSLSNIIAISAGESHSLFLKNDGTVWACGLNNVGQLGIGNTTSANTPVQINSLNGIIAIGGGTDFSLFLKSDSTVWGCGINGYGQLGNGNNNIGYYKETPTQVIGLSSISAISGGSAHSLFLKSDGTVWACGYSRFGALGDGTTTRKNIPVNIGVVCTPPSPPEVDYSSMPNTTCVGSTVNTDPSISGSNPVLTMSVDNSIQINNPKAITKNKNSVFVLNDNDAIARFNLNGTLVSNYPFLSVSGILAFAADDSSNVYLFNGDGNIYKCDSTGALVNTLSTLWLGSTGNQLVFTQPVNPTLYPENLFLIDQQQYSGSIITGINTYDDGLSNSAIYPSDSIANAQITSMAIDNFYEGKRALLADPVNSTLRTRILYPDGSGNFNYQENYLLAPSSTAGMAFNFIDADTLFNMFAVSSSNTGKLGVGASYRNTDGALISNLDTSITSLINPIQPVGIVLTKLGSGYQFWVADRGQGKILRAYPTMYQISPSLPAGLNYNSITGKISGTPTEVTSAQTYQVILNTPYGADTSYFTFAVTPTTGVSNTPGTASSSAEHQDGMTIKYFDPYNCSSLIEIKDSIGGTSPGQTQVTQVVTPSVINLGNKTFVRRSSTITAEKNDTIKASLKLMYSYDDINQYNIANPNNKVCNLAGTACNDTTVGVVDIAVLQMHEFYNADKGLWEKEPIFHSPVTATWNSNLHMWVTDNILLTKLSDFYAGPVSVATGFDCSNTGDSTLTVFDAYYVWNSDTLYTAGDFVDTLVNQSGCDSITTLHLTFQTTGISDLAKESGIYIFPNPSTGSFNIKFDKNATDPKRIRVTNMLNTEVYNTVLTGSSTIDISNQTSGIYFISVETENGTSVVWRVIKQ